MSAPEPRELRIQRISDLVTAQMNVSSGSGAAAPVSKNTPLVMDRGRPFLAMPRATQRRPGPPNGTRSPFYRPVSSLRTLRQLAKTSKAKEAFVGFGNPMLVGPNGNDKQAWDRQSCQKADIRASAGRKPRSAQRRQRFIAAISPTPAVPTARHARRAVRGRAIGGGTANRRPRRAWAHALIAQRPPATCSVWPET